MQLHLRQIKTTTWNCIITSQRFITRERLLTLWCTLFMEAGQNTTHVQPWLTRTDPRIKGENTNIIFQGVHSNHAYVEVKDKIPWEVTFKISGSTITSGSSWLVSPFASNFLVSPHRLEPPCMLGMFRTATPSMDRPLRSRGVPQHWGEHNRRQQCLLYKSIILSQCRNFLRTEYKLHTCRVGEHWSHLNC